MIPSAKVNEELDARHVTQRLVNECRAGWMWSEDREFSQVDEATHRAANFAPKEAIEAALKATP